MLLHIFDSKTELKTLHAQFKDILDEEGVNLKPTHSAEALGFWLFGKNWSNCMMTAETDMVGLQRCFDHAVVPHLYACINRYFEPKLEPDQGMLVCTKIWERVIAKTVASSEYQDDFLHTFYCCWDESIMPPDVNSPLPWGAPWLFKDPKVYALTGDPVTDAEHWYKANEAELIEIAREEAQYQ